MAADPDDMVELLALHTEIGGVLRMYPHLELRLDANSQLRARVMLHRVGWWAPTSVVADGNTLDDVLGSMIALSLHDDRPWQATPGPASNAN